MKRKWLLLLTALLLVASLFVFGCNEDNGNSVNNGKTPVDPNNPVEPNNPGEPGEPEPTKDPNLIYFTAEPNNGRLHKEDTSIITLTFDTLIPRNTVLASHVTIEKVTGEIETFAMVNANADTRNLSSIVVKKEGTIKITINYPNEIGSTKKKISSAPVEVMVYKKLGMEPDDSVTINDIVTYEGAKVKGENITFARYDGEPAAVIQPRVTTPVTGVNAASPAFTATLVEFDPPLDLITTEFVEFRWIDMVWQGFKDNGEYDFANPSTASGSPPYTGTRYDLHKVGFYLDLITENNERIRLSVESETEKNNNKSKQPVRFEKATHILTTAGNSAWADGHKIKRIDLTAHNIQLRSPNNQNWPSLKADTMGTDPDTGESIITDGARNPIIEETYILKLAIDFNKPPPRRILYNREGGGWDPSITNPKMGMSDEVFKAICSCPVGECTNPLTHARSAADPKGLLVMDGMPSRFIWDPIDISVPAGATPYSMIRATVTATGLGWSGYGVISIPVAGGDPQIRMDFNSGVNGNSAWNIPFESPAYGTAPFNWEKFSGIFVQGNADGEIQLNLLYIE